MQDTGLPGMRVMQFGFLDESDNMHLPHTTRKFLCLHGYHDNNTALGWLWEASPQQRQWASILRFHRRDWAEGGVGSKSCKALVNALWQSPANVAIVPIQDLCGLARIQK